MHTAEKVPELGCSRLGSFIVCAVVMNADKIDAIPFCLDALHKSMQPSPGKSPSTSWGRTSQSHAGRLKLWPETERFLNRHVRLILHIGFVERQEHLAIGRCRGEIFWIDVLLIPDHRNELDVLHRCSHRSYAPVVTPAGSTALQHTVNAIIAPVADPLLRRGHHLTWSSLTNPANATGFRCRLLPTHQLCTPHWSLARRFRCIGSASEDHQTSYDCESNGPKTHGTHHTRSALHRELEHG